MIVLNFVGDLTEVQLPVDYLSKKIKGFAFITYMIPENAVRAFTTLDGTSFMVNENEEIGTILEGFK